MNTVSSPVSQAASHVTWWSRIAHQGKSEVRRETPPHIDTDEFSDHMLRDVGLRDGRPVRGERSHPDDLNSVLRDYTKRSL
jgi:hypothetical protein